MRVAVSGAGGGDAVESGFDGCVSDGVDVDDESLLIGGDTELVKLFLLKKQIAVVARVLVGLSEVRGLGRKFSDAVGKDFDSGDVQVGDIFIGVARLLDGGELGGGILG